LWAWGLNNNHGQLGLNDRVNRSSPVQVGALSDWAQVSTGLITSFTVKTDGTLWAWGYNTNGQLGLNDIARRSSPVQVGALSTWAQVSASAQQQTLAIRTNGTLWAWGENTNGGLGLNDIANRSSPVQVGALSNWAQVSAGSSFSLAVKTDGTLWAWGLNFAGQLGLNNVADRSSPVQVGALSTWAQVSASSSFSLAVKTDGTLWAWGLGTGSSPVQVGAFANWATVLQARSGVRGALSS
jgi:alpha-tubulin suppressor-like RCC1 family protein